MTEDEIILTSILQCRTLDLAINKPVLTSTQQEQFDDYKSRRQEGEPLQYILGTCNFMGLELMVNPSVLIPRPETEQLVDAALKVFKTGIALDLGTGSGNIAIALAKLVPDSKIISIDISAKALDVARVNARTHQVEKRIEFINADMLNENVIYNIAEETIFDLIISNPPYVPTDQLGSLPLDVQNEPTRALDGGEDGLNFYRNIIKYTHSLLRSGACLMMEFGDGQAEAIKMLIEAQGTFKDIKIIQDLAGRDRIISSMRI